MGVRKWCQIQDLHCTGCIKLSQVILMDLIISGLGLTLERSRKLNGKIDPDRRRPGVLKKTKGEPKDFCYLYQIHFRVDPVRVQGPW